MMVIRELADSERTLWDAYVRGAEGGLPQHLSGWREVMAAAYGYDTCYLMALSDDTETPVVRGVLPLYLNPSALLGRSLTTMPGGLCAEDDETAEALIAHGMELARRLRAKRFVLHDTRQSWPGPLRTECAHEAWIVDVQAGEEAVWQALDRNIRRQVRMARRNGLVVEIDRSGARLGDLYAVLSRFAHAAGTPVFGRDFLEHVVEQFPHEHNMALVYSDGNPIAGYFQLEMGDAVYGVWGAALHEYLELRPVYLAYWELLADTMARGFRRLDMGRAPRDSNASKYKGQWNGRPVPVYQQTALLRGGQETGSVAARAQSDGKFQLVRRIWPKLPYPVAQFLGPKLRRHVPFA